MNASSALLGRANSALDEESASDTNHGNVDNPTAALSGRTAHELSSWEWLPATVKCQTRGQSHHLEGDLV